MQACGEAVAGPCEGQQAVEGRGDGQTGGAAIEGIAAEHPLGGVDDAVAVGIGAGEAIGG